MAQVISLTHRQREYLKELLATALGDDGPFEHAPEMRKGIEEVLGKIEKNYKAELNGIVTAHDTDPNVS